MKTIKPKWPETKQEVFDKVWHHFITNGSSPGIGPAGICCYYNASTHNRCAIGILMSEEDARSMPNGSIGQLAFVQSVVVPKVLLPLLVALQVSHDYYAEASRSFRSDFSEDLKRIAATFNLKVPE